MPIPDDVIWTEWLGKTDDYSDPANWSHGIPDGEQIWWDQHKGGTIWLDCLVEA